MTKPHCSLNHSATTSLSPANVKVLGTGIAEALRTSSTKGQPPVSSSSRVLHQHKYTVFLPPSDYELRFPEWCKGGGNNFKFEFDTGKTLWWKLGQWVHMYLTHPPCKTVLIHFAN